MHIFESTLAALKSGACVDATERRLTDACDLPGTRAGVFRDARAT